MPRRTARRRRCACACSTSASTSTASTRTSTTARDDARRNYDRVLFSPHQERRRRGGRPPRRPVGRRQGQDRQPAAPSNGKTGAMLVKVERLDQRPLAGPAVPHLGDPGHRDLADLAGRARLHRHFEDFVAERFPSSQAGDFAVLEAGIVSEETYVEQGLYWEKSYHPLIKYVLDNYQPDLALVGYPVTDEIQHQFLGLVTKTLPNGAPNPAYDDVEVNGTPDGRVKQREEFIRARLRGRRRHHAPRPEAHARQRPERRSSPPTTGSRRSSWRSTPARCSSTSACCPRRRPRTAARPPARRSARPRPAGPAARCRSTSTSPGATRPAAGSSRSPAADEAADGRADQGRVPGARATRTTGPATASPRAGR